MTGGIDGGAATARAPDPERLARLEEGMRILLAGPQIPTGTSAKEVVWTRNKTTLHRYLPIAPRAHATPVLLVYALVNKPYILDLRPDTSLVRHLLGHGYDVFLLDWGVAGWEDRDLGLDELVGDHLPAAVARMRRAGAGDDYTLLGYCMGGTMGVMHAALRPEGLRNLVALTTPVDFSDAGTFSVWTDPANLDPAHLARALGNIPGDLIDLGNKLLTPVKSFVDTPSAMWERLMNGRDMTSWLAMNKWVNDGVPFPGAAFAQWITAFYQENRLVGGELRVGGEPVDLGRITAPLLAIAAARDHIVPPAMARPLVDLVGSRDRRYLEFPAGHVGLVVGSAARTGLWPAVVDWLDARSD